MMVNEQEVYQRLRDLAKRGGLIDPNLIVLPTYLDVKILGVQIFRDSTLEKIDKLQKYFEEESKNKVYLKETTKYWHESIVFYEAYLNAIYSFFEVLSKLTPLFYDEKEIGGSFPSRGFKKQRKYLIETKPEVDRIHSEYLQNMKLVEVLENDRHAVIHYISAFFGFDKENEVLVLNMKNKNYDFWEKNKSHSKLRDKIMKIWNDLFEYLRFYTEHYSFN